MTKGESPLLKGNATPPKGTDASGGRHEPFGQAGPGGIQPPVMLSHLANPKAAGLKELLKKTLNAGLELGQPSIPQNSRSHSHSYSHSQEHSAQPHSQGSDAALRTVRVTARPLLASPISHASMHASQNGSTHCSCSCPSRGRTGLYCPGPC